MRQFLFLTCLFVCFSLFVCLFPIFYQCTICSPLFSPFTMMPFRTVIIALMKATVDTRVPLVWQTGDRNNGQVKTAVQRELETFVKWLYLEALFHVSPPLSFQKWQKGNACVLWDFGGSLKSKSLCICRQHLIVHHLSLSFCKLEDKSCDE